LNLRLDQFLLGILLSSSSLGFYTVAVSISGLLNILPDAIGLVLFPSIAGADRHWAGKTTAWLLRLTLLAGVSMALALAVIAEPLITLIYGDAFKESIAPLLFALPGAVFLALAKIATKYIDGIGRPELSSACTTAGLVVGGASLIPLIHQWGLVGAAIGAGLGYATIGIAAILVFRRLAEVTLVDCMVPRPSDVRAAMDRIAHEVSLARGRNRAA
jgi:O-antigen/teichoic acid export membrane protein